MKKAPDFKILINLKAQVFRKHFANQYIFQLVKSLIKKKNEKKKKRN